MLLIRFNFNSNSLPKSIRLKTVVTMNITTVIIVLLQYQQRGIASLLKVMGTFPQQLLLQLPMVMQSTDEPQMDRDLPTLEIIQGHYHTHTQCPQAQQCLNVVTKLGQFFGVHIVRSLPQIQAHVKCKHEFNALSDVHDKMNFK